MASKLPRGRPRLDPAVKLRTQVWAIAVRVQSDMAWDALDQLCIPALENRRDNERSRVMHRYFRHGHVPGAVVVEDSEYPNGKSIPIVEAISRIDGLKSTKSEFDSILWDFLIPPGKSVAEMSAVVRSLLAKRGWYQADDESGRIGQHLIPNDPAFVIRKSWNASDLGFHLSVERGLEAIALTAGLTRLAVDATDYIAAGSLQGSLAGVLLNTAPSFFPFDSPDTRRRGAREKNVIYDRVLRELKQLVDQRILRNEWPLQAKRSEPEVPRTVEPPSHPLRQDATPDAQLQALSEMVERLWGPPNPSQLGKVKWWPIVRSQPQHLWIEQRRAELAGGIRLEFANQIASASGAFYGEAMKTYASHPAKKSLQDIPGFRTYMKRSKM